jgi:hypothetical protein
LFRQLGQRLVALKQKGRPKSRFRRAAGSPAIICPRRPQRRTEFELAVGQSCGPHVDLGTILPRIDFADDAEADLYVFPGGKELMTLPSRFRRAARWRDEGRHDPLPREGSSNAGPARSNPSAALAAGPRAIAAIDEEAGLIRLTSTFAHSSREWLSSEWPVCPIAETAAPRRDRPHFDANQGE